MPTSAKPRKTARRANADVALLVYDDLCTFEFACVAEVFGMPAAAMGPDWYRLHTVAAESGPVRSPHGVRIAAEESLDALAAADTIVIPGWKSIDAPVPRRLADALRQAHARGARLLSICSGAFVLAETGLLDGRRATTHWLYADALQRRYPAIRVEPDVLYIDEGQLLTSAGSAAGLDLCLHLVRRDFGPETANLVARRMVIPPHRDGGQAQFVARPVARRERNPLSRLLDTMQRRLDQPLSIPELAEMAAMSERTFIRRFKEITGTTPGDWLIAARVDRARELLESGSLPVDQVAADCGFGTAITLRHHFRRRVGINPTTYRARFGRQAASA